MAFDVEGARAAGYTDSEIVAHLSKARAFDVDGARKAGYSDGEIIGHLSKPAPVKSGAEQIPGYVAPSPRTPDPTLGQQIVGAGEAALSTATGATTGLAGGVLNFIGVLGEELARRQSGEFLTTEASKRINEAFGAGQRAYTYQPRTEAGQDALGAVADVGAALTPLAGLTGELGMIAQSGRAARVAPAATTVRASAEGIARDVAGPGAAQAVSTAIDATSARAAALKETASLLPQRTAALVFGEAEAAPTAGTKGSVGAAGTDLAAQRVATAESLGFTGDKALTTGQATREFGAQQFERETAKNASVGAPLRDRFANQNAQLAAVLDSSIDSVGAVAPDVREAGRTVVKEVSDAAARSKREYRLKYQAAEKAGELQAPVDLADIVRYLDEVAPEATTAPLIDTARKVALKLGIAKEGGAVEGPSWNQFVGERMGPYMKSEGGHGPAIKRIGEEWAALKASQQPGGLASQPVTLKTAEQFRQAINRNIDTEPTNIRQGTIIKQLIDQATEGQGGDLYREARKARQRHAQLFEDNAIVSDLLAMRRGTADRRVALEDVFNRTILNGDRESLGALRRTLDVSDQKAGFRPQTDGPGAQAWRELQGSTLRHLLEKATENVATDQAGAPIFSAAKLDRAIKSLEHGNKLDFVLGKQRAQMVRDLNEVAKVVQTAPPGSVNTSNTASAVMAAIAEAGLTGSVTGLPVPVLSTLKAGAQFVKDVKLRRRVQASLAGVRAPT